MFVTPFFNNALNSFVVVSASATISLLRAAALCYPAVLSHQALAQETRAQSRTRLPLRLDKVREVPFRDSRTEQCGRHDVCMSLHLLVHRAVIPNQQRESRAVGRQDL